MIRDCSDFLYSVDYDKKCLKSLNEFIFKVRIDLTEAEHVCSAASKRGQFRQEIKVGAKSIRSVPFTIIPTKEGQHRIEIKAAVKDSELGISDGIVKMLQVVVRKKDIFYQLT